MSITEKGELLFLLSHSYLEVVWGRGGLNVTESEPQIFPSNKILTLSRQPLRGALFSLFHLNKNVLVLLSAPPNKYVTSFVHFNENPSVFLPVTIVNLPSSG